MTGSEKIKQMLLVTRSQFISILYEYFFAILDERTELSSSFIEGSSEIGRKVKSLQAKQRKRQNTCKDYVIDREITTIHSRV